ncbi:hypothetical protein C0995_011793, partial [Termitomyces sp. Mi166
MLKRFCNLTCNSSQFRILSLFSLPQLQKVLPIQSQASPLALSQAQFQSSSSVPPTSQEHLPSPAQPQPHPHQCAALDNLGTPFFVNWLMSLDIHLLDIETNPTVKICIFKQGN